MTKPLVAIYWLNINRRQRRLDIQFRTEDAPVIGADRHQPQPKTNQRPPGAKYDTEEEDEKQ